MKFTLKKFFSTLVRANATVSAIVRTAAPALTAVCAIAALTVIGPAAPAFADDTAPAASTSPAPPRAPDSSDVILKLLLDKEIISVEEFQSVRRQVLEAEAHKKALESAQVQAAPAQHAPGAQGNPEIYATELEQRIGRLEQYTAYDFQPDRMRSYWHDGLEFKTQDEAFKFKIGARLMSDFVFANETEGWNDAYRDEFGEVRDGGELRETRLNFHGTLYRDYDFKLQIDFRTGDPEIKDAFFARQNIPYIGTLRAGQFKLPVGLENNTSKRFITFMERAQERGLLTQRELGVMMYNTALGNRVYYAAGIFRDIADTGDPNPTGGGDYMAAGRITGLPIYEDGGRKLIHTGFSFTYTQPNDNEVRFRARPEVHILERLINTRTIEDTDHWRRMGGELAGVWGPLSAQGEYIQVEVDSPEGGTVGGWYGYVSYALTGEHRQYDASLGEFQGIVPKENFELGGKGIGAWEIGARYSTADFNDGFIEGGSQDVITLGLNWYLNPNMRIMFNYVKAMFPDATDAEIDIYMTRFQLNF